MIVPPAAVQVNVGCDAIAWPNWSSATAVNVCAAFSAKAAFCGETATEAAVCVTVTGTSLVVLLLPSLIVTRSVYGPAAAKLAVVSFEAFVPLAENVTGAGGVPTTAQV